MDGTVAQSEESLRHDKHNADGHDDGGYQSDCNEDFGSLNVVSS